MFLSSACELLDRVHTDRVFPASGCEPLDQSVFLSSPCELLDLKQKIRHTYQRSFFSRFQLPTGTKDEDFP